MLKRDIQRGIIHSFKPTSTNDIYENWGRGICEFCDEHVDAAKMAEHDCSQKGVSLFILLQEKKDELMAIVYQEDGQEESVKVENLGKKLRELDECED